MPFPQQILSSKSSLPVHCWQRSTETLARTSVQEAALACACRVLAAHARAAPMTTVTNALRAGHPTTPWRVRAYAKQCRRMMDRVLRQRSSETLNEQIRKHSRPAAPFAGPVNKLCRRSSSVRVAQSTYQKNHSSADESYLLGMTSHLRARNCRFDFSNRTRIHALRAAPLSGHDREVLLVLQVCE